MKTTIVVIALIAALGFSADAQNISAAKIKIGYSKEAVKASKNGSLYNAGFFVSEDKSKLYKLSTFTQKKTDVEMLEIHTFDQSGVRLTSEILPLTDESLAKYSLQRFEDKIEGQHAELNNLEVCYVKNPVLAGKPNIISGKLSPQTNELGVFTRFKFQKETNIELDDQFWAQVYYPLGANVIERNNHLLQPAPRKKVAREIFKMRNSFMPTENKAYIGGMMAVSGGNMFLSGIMDLKTSTWLSKHEIEIPFAFDPGRLNYVKLNNGETGILLTSKDQFTYLHLNDDGSKKNIIPLSTTKSGGQNGVQPSTYLLQQNDDVLCFSTTSNALNGGNIGISIAKVSEDKEVWSKNYVNEDLIKTTILPSKEKVKVNKLIMPYIENVMKTNNDDYLVFLKATKNTANAPETNFLIIQISKDGELLSTYALPAIKPMKDEKFTTSLPIKLVKAGESFYAIVRTEVDGHEKGTYTSSTTNDFGDFERTTTTSYRKDISETAGYVVKINPLKKQLSNVVFLEDFILGDFPGVLSENNSLFINTAQEIVVIK